MTDFEKLCRDALALQLYRIGTGISKAPETTKHLDPRARQKYRKMARKVIELSSGDGFVEAQCAVCKCTDSKACPGGCSWVIVNRLIGKGVCSGCTSIDIDRLGRL